MFQVTSVLVAFSPKLGTGRLPFGGVQLAGGYPDVQICGNFTGCLGAGQLAAVFADHQHTNDRTPLGTSYRWPTVLSPTLVEDVSVWRNFKPWVR